MSKKMGILILTLLCAGAMLCACGGGGKGNTDTPENTVSGFINAVKDGNIEEAEGYLVSSDSVSGMNTLRQADSNRIKDSTASLSYEIASTAMFEEASEGDAETESYGGALLVVNITTKDMNVFSEKLSGALLAEAGNFASMSEKEIEKFWDTAMANALSETTETVTTAVDFTLINDQGSWKIKSDSGFFSAAFGLGAFLDF